MDMENWMKKDCKIKKIMIIKKGKLKPLDYVPNVKWEITGLINAIPNFIKMGLLCWETSHGTQLGSSKTI